MNIQALQKRLDRIGGPDALPPTMVVEFVGKEPFPLKHATINGTRHSPNPGEEENEFITRLEAENPSSLIFIHREQP